MSFHMATGIPGKADMPAACQCVFTGYERAIMHYEMTGVEATLSLKPVPTVYLKTQTLHGIHSYLASQFIDCAAKGSRFGIGPAWDDQMPVFIDAQEVADFALWIRSKVTPNDGRFETIWVQSDANCPF